METNDDVLRELERSGEPFDHWLVGDRVRLLFRCPEHGMFERLLPVRSVGRAPPPPRLTDGCEVVSEIRNSFEFAVGGRCCRVSPWVRSTEDDDPGDEG